MIEKKKVFFILARVAFTGVFFVTSLGFVIWEANGLINWEAKTKVSESKIIKMAKVSNEPVALGDAQDIEKEESTNVVVAADARPVIIKKYLEKYKSPLAPYSDLIFELSQTYGYDYRWIVAIAQQESNLCKKIPENSHNCWGYGINKAGTLRFDSYDLSIRSYAEYLKRAYFDKGLDTPELVMKKYCPSSNGSWAVGVRKFMDDMDSGNI